jgi:hypothetical protein
VTCAATGSTQAEAMIHTATSDLQTFPIISRAPLSPSDRFPVLDAIGCSL